MAFLIRITLDCKEPRRFFISSAVALIEINLAWCGRFSLFIGII